MATIAPERKLYMEVDFLVGYVSKYDGIINLPDDPVTGEKRTKIQAYDIKKTLKDRFLSEVVGEVWHTDTDQLQYIQIYDNGTYYCQRRKPKYDHVTKVSTSTAYEYKGATQEDADKLVEDILSLIEAQTVVRSIEISSTLSEVDKEYMFFDHTYNKRLTEKQALLAVTDWRILPDVEDSYVGEKDMWKKYRAELRKLVPKDPTEYATPLDFFKSISTMKWPVDPKIFFAKYPDGKDSDGLDVEYLKEGDDTQWVERETESSRDLMESKLINIGELRQRYVDSRRIVNQKVQDIMKLMRVEEIIEGGVDYTTMYTEEEINDMAGS